MDGLTVVRNIISNNSEKDYGIWKQWTKTQNKFGRNQSFLINSSKMTLKNMTGGTILFS